MEHPVQHLLAYLRVLEVGKEVMAQAFLLASALLVGLRIKAVPAVGALEVLVQRIHLMRVQREVAILVLLVMVAQQVLPQQQQLVQVAMALREQVVKVVAVAVLVEALRA